METYLRNLKQSQLNEVSRLQARAQDQANTFDLLRNFVKRRIEIEEVYARSLEKLAKSFSVPNQSECNKMLDILFQQTEKEAQTRIEMTGSWNFQVMSRLEDLEKEKVPSAKIICESASKVIEGTDHSLLIKSHKRFETATKEAILTKQKFDAAATKHSPEAKKLEKIKAKWQLADQNMLLAQNEFCLNSQRLTAMADSFFDQDFEKLLELVDGTFYQSFQEVISSFFDCTNPLFEFCYRSQLLLRETCYSISREKDKILERSSKPTFPAELVVSLVKDHRTKPILDQTLVEHKKEAIQTSLEKKSVSEELKRLQTEQKDPKTEFERSLEISKRISDLKLQLVHLCSEEVQLQSLLKQLSECNTLKQLMYRAKEDCNEENYLTYAVGDIIKVTKKNDEWFGCLNDRTGKVNKTHLELCQ